MAATDRLAERVFEFFYESLAPVPEIFPTPMVIMPVLLLQRRLTEMKMCFDCDPATLGVRKSYCIVTSKLA